MDTNEIIKKVSGYFLRRNDIDFSYLFGSCARQEQGKLSDIDIAVSLSDKIQNSSLADIRLELIGDLCKLLNTDRLDVVILDNANLALSFRIIHDGIIIHAKEELKRTRYEARIMSMYFDMQYYYKRHSRNTIETIAAEGIL